MEEKGSPWRGVDPWGFFSRPHCSITSLAALPFQCEELYLYRSQRRVRAIDKAMTISYTETFQNNVVIIEMDN